MSRLDLIVPGLFGPFEAELPDYVRQQLNQPVFKVLKKTVSRSVHSSCAGADFHSTLQQLICPDCELSLCELSAQYSDMEITQGFYYRADPVHFKAESDHAILLGTDLLELQSHEAEQLIEQFNLHFAEDGICLLIDDHGHWYLQREQALSLDYHALDYALGRDIKHFLPVGDDELWWRRIVNEAQMLFFQHPVNQQREEQGRLTVNGLWLWDRSFKNDGNAVNDRPEYQYIYTDNLVAKSMGAITAAEELPVEAFMNSGVKGKDNLLVLDQLYPAVSYGDMDAWLEDLQVFCSGVFNSVLQRLHQGEFKEINIFPCDGRVLKVTRNQQWKFWQVVKPLDKFLSNES